MRFAVFDTNVVVSGMLSPHGSPGRIVDCLRCGTLIAVLDDCIFAEYSEVLARPKLGLPKGEVRLVLDAIRRKAQFVEALPEFDPAGLPDPDDAPFLACALATGVCLVTGNLRHFPKRVVGGVEVLTPAAFLTRNVERTSGPL